MMVWALERQNKSQCVNVVKTFEYDNEEKNLSETAGKVCLMGSNWNEFLWMNSWLVQVVWTQQEERRKETSN